MDGPAGNKTVFPVMEKGKGMVCFCQEKTSDGL